MGNLIRRIRPSNFIFLLVLPGVVYLFLTAEDYRRAFAFIIPGIWTTVFVAVGAYFASAALGLLFAVMLSFKRGERTLLWFSVTTVLLIAGSVVLFNRAPIDYVLVGNLEGRIAIISGTPQRISGQVRSGAFEGGDAEAGYQIRGVADVERALEVIRDDERITGAFIPLALAPDDLPQLWTTRFLEDAYWTPALLLAVFAVALILLILGSLQSGLHPLAVFAELYIDLVRGIPILVIILFVGFVLARAIQDSLGIRLNQYTRGVAALSIGYSAYMAEIFRAGIEAIPKGQSEAARSLGLSGWQTARYVILPQAIRIVIPPLGNEFIAMLKDSALLSIISVRELTQRTREFQSNTFILFPTFNTAAIIYVVLTLGASSVLKWVERRANTEGE
jgi:polar amino acid transport system permease protein